ncbi:hypothetical protein [Pseudomonas veronii]|uniref:hypothetical protein n=1 Tax=Pseudomonas veronii TaxID=76761 RepID=UPI0023DFC2F2|nr:hypothetical protein [Pseudomonas veronii]MDF3239970.1 hypothetical protein [Pseudomonas veronii]
MSNDPKLVEALNRLVRTADQSIRAAAHGRPDPQSQADTINQLANVIMQLDARIVTLEETIKGHN